MAEKDDRVLYLVDFDGDGLPVAVQHVGAGERIASPASLVGGRRRYFVARRHPVWRFQGTPACMLGLVEALRLVADELPASRLGLGTGAVWL